MLGFRTRSDRRTVSVRSSRDSVLSILPMGEYDRAILGLMKNGIVELRFGVHGHDSWFWAHQFYCCPRLLRSPTPTVAWDATQRKSTFHQAGTDCRSDLATTLHTVPLFPVACRTVRNSLSFMTIDVCHSCSPRPRSSFTEPGPTCSASNRDRSHGTQVSTTARCCTFVHGSNK